MATELDQSELELAAQALATSACVNLRRSSRVITRWFDEELEPSGLRSTQLAIMLAVAVTERPTYSRVARALATDTSTLSRNLMILERDGLIKTEAGRTARHKIVSLTPKGIKHVREAIPLWARTQKTFLSHFGAEAWSEFLQGLGAVISSARAGSLAAE